MRTAVTLPLLEFHGYSQTLASGIPDLQCSLNAFDFPTLIIGNYAVPEPFLTTGWLRSSSAFDLVNLLHADTACVPAFERSSSNPTTPTIF